MEAPAQKARDAAGIRPLHKNVPAYVHDELLDAAAMSKFQFLSSKKQTVDFLRRLFLSWN